MKKLMLALISALAVLSLATGCTSDKVTTTKDGKTETKEAKDVTVKVGETFDFADFTFKTANLREVKPEYGTETYQVLDITITAKEDGKMFTGQIQGATADNVVVNSEFVMDNNIGDAFVTAFTKNLSKGQSAKGYVAFKKSSAVTKAELTASALNKQKVTITLV